jgi:hypothetical protein
VDARVIVDSSKRPSDASILRLVPDIEPYFIHLVRDPRAVAYSWGRRKPQPDRTEATELERHGVLGSTTNWLAWNLGAEALSRRTQHFFRMRYEDFISSPVQAIESVIRFVGETTVSVPIIGKQVTLKSNHTVSGNPSRFQTGTIELRNDDEWMFRQQPVDRFAATAIASPLLKRYEYPVLPRATRPGRE